MPPRIAGLYWPPGAEEHVERHINAWEIDELVESGDFVAFRNTRDQPPHRRRVIGRTPDGLFVTAILQEPEDGNPAMWVVITGWRSTAAERTRYFQAKKET